MSPLEQLAAALIESMAGPLADRVTKEVLALLAGQKAANDDEPLLGAGDVAARVGVSTDTLYGWLKRHPELPRVNVGGPLHPVYRMRLSEVTAWLHARHSADRERG